MGCPLPEFLFMVCPPASTLLPFAFFSHFILSSLDGSLRRERESLVTNSNYILNQLFEHI
jgi:hypothetical protein